MEAEQGGERRRKQRQGFGTFKGRPEARPLVAVHEATEEVVVCRVRRGVRSFRGDDERLCLELQKM